MKKTFPSKQWRQIILGLLWCFATLAETTQTVLDLSYHHNLGHQTIVQAVQQHLAILSNQDVVEIDVSHSVLGDKGLEELLVVLAVPNETGDLQFTARANGLTPQSVTLLIDAMLRNATTDVKPLSLASLDLGWNNLHPEALGAPAFLKALQRLIATPTRCPTVFRLDNCGLGPAACRAIGKALIARYDNKGVELDPSALSLYLSGNHDLGDAAAAALAAAVRTLVTSKDDGCLVFDTLDLSACNIGDVGAEALALALEDSPSCCIQKLILSNNQITEQGALSLGRALVSGDTKEPRLLSLDLSNNKIGDRGVTTIATAMEKGRIPRLMLRSCHLHDVSCIGTALRAIAFKPPTHDIDIDLSGNPLGVLRGKSSKDGGGKYSASRLKSKASATASSYFNLLKKSVSPILASGQSAESDDEEEKNSGQFGESEDDPSLIRCGAKSFALSFLEDDSNKAPTTDRKEERDDRSLNVHIALRRCFFDHGAADALAAILVSAKDDTGLDLTIDVDLNPVLEENMVAALQGDTDYESLLREMAERFMDQMEAIQESRRRASEAAKVASTRIRDEERFGDWSPATGFGDEDEEADFWDSDADYDDEDDYSY